MEGMKDKGGIKLDVRKADRMKGSSHTGKVATVLGRKERKESEKRRYEEEKGKGKVLQRGWKKNMECLSGDDTKGMLGRERERWRGTWVKA